MYIHPKITVPLRRGKRIAFGEHRMANRERPFVVLDGLRGVAAFAIVIRHGTAYFGNALYESYLAVDFFFVLSGFVLAYAYSERLDKGALSTNDFMRLRLIRLYPLYALSLAISVIRIFAHGARVHVTLDWDLSVQLLAAILFVPYVINSTGVLFPLNGPSWSLFFELVANLGFSVALKRTGKLLIPWIVVAAAVVMAWAALNRHLGFGFNPDTGVLDNGFTRGSIVAGFVRVSYSFFCGVFIYGLWETKRRLPSVHPIVIAIALFAVLAMHPAAEYQPIYDVMVAIIIFPLMVLLGAGSVATGLTGRTFAIVGVVSYGIYVLQQPIYAMTHPLGEFVATHYGQYADIVFGISVVIMIFVITLVADKYYDRPVRTALARYFMGRRLKIPHGSLNKLFARKIEEA